jgi:hypothetical protein
LKCELKKKLKYVTLTIFYAGAGAGNSTKKAIIFIFVENSWVEILGNNRLQKCHDSDNNLAGTV